MQLFGIENKREHQQKLNRFKTVLVGGASIHSTLWDALKDCKTNIFETYGMTETVSHVALKKVGNENAFALLNGIEAKLDGRGCLNICADVTNNHWLATNDCAEFISPRSFVVTGRIDNVINTGGIKVQAEKVEAALASHLPNTNYYVFGVPHSKLGEQVTLVIEGKQNITLDGLKSKTQDILTPYEFPKQLIFVDVFKRTESGKLDRLGSLR